MRSFRTYAWLLVFLLTAGLFVQWYLKRNSSRKPIVQIEKQQPKSSDKPSINPPPEFAAPKEYVESKDLRVSDDEESKKADFWVEQSIDVAASAVSAKEVLDFYISLDPATMKGARLRARNGEAVLEQLDPAPTVLARAPLTNLAAGENVFGALWRRGELSVWHGAQLILKWSPSGAAPAFAGRSGAQVMGAGIKMGPRRTVALNSIRFEDSFMRDASNGAWRPQSGRWELTALAFPERSANPFSLRTTFGAEQPVGDPLYNDRLRENEYGLGIMISQYEGTLHIARITGGSPAARAGLQEDDIFLEVDGNAVEDFDSWQVYQMLMRGFGGDCRLKMLRPGEKKPREFTITREQFRWGTPAEGKPIQPVREPETLGSDRVSMILCGDPGWSDYAAEVAVKPLGYGGFGLIIAATSPQDYVLFRWRGPGDPAAALAPGKPPLAMQSVDTLQLVRVSGGHESILAEKAAAYRPYEFYRMGVNWNGDKIKCIIDDNEILSASVPDLRRGQIGLYALKGMPVFFDDVRVASDRASLIAAHHPERALNDIFVSEDDMEAWANPALEWDRDLKTGWAVHQSRFPGEQAVVLIKPKFKDLDIRLSCREGPESGAGPHLEIRNGQATFAGGFKSESIKIGPGQIQRIAVRGDVFKAEAEIDGQKISARRDLVAGEPMPGDRIAIRGLSNLGDPQCVRVTSANILEYTFNTSPTDWKVESGRWGLLNKWICDPRWSWFGGRSKTLAALWNKNNFSGNISVDAYVALMMQRDDPPFERPGDYNITICGDGVNLDSGYTLVFAGDNNSWTRLYRKGKVVAESTLEDHRIFSDRIRHPDKPELHQRWFHVKLEKIGNEISFYRDGNLAFTFKDPDSIQEGRTAFWTLENGFLLSRVRIAHNGMKPAPFESRRAGLYNDSEVINQFDGESLTSVQRQALPPAIEASLNSARDAFRTADADPLPPDAAKLDAPAAPATPPPAYRVTNGTSGGPMVLQWKSFLIDPERKGVLRFAYCIEPGTQIDLYLLDINPGSDQVPVEPFRQRSRISNPKQLRAYRWRISGPRESSENAALVGEIPDIKADGRWHTVQFDLQPSWRALWRTRGYNRPGPFAGRMIVGNLDNHGYLLAGMNGNHVGASYSLSEMTLLTAAESDHTPPKVDHVVWPYDEGGDGRSISIFFNDAGGSGIAEESLQADLNGVSIPREMAEFDPIKQVLKIDLLRMNLPSLSTSPTLSLKLLGFQDRAQNASAGGFIATYKYEEEKAAKAAKPVIAPRVSINVANEVDIVPSSGPLGLNEITPIAPVARLQESLDAPPWAPSGARRSVQVVNVNDGSAFGFALSNANYGLRHWPYLLIDYKIPFETPMNLHLYDQSGLTHALLLTDVYDERDPLSREIATRAGPPADFKADGTWRRSIVPLQKLFDASGMHPAQAAFIDLRGMSLHDNGWRGNRRGMEYWIHRIQPIAAGRPSDLKFSWQAGDITGIVDYVSSIDDKPDVDPGGRKEIASGETLEAAIGRMPASRNLKDGWNYLHLRVKNAAGVWSDTVHQPFFLDTTPPKVIRTEPADGGTCSGQSLKIFLDEDHGLDQESLRLIVNGKLINSGWRGFIYDPATRCITFKASQAAMSWPNGEKVTVEVRGLKDLLGNRAELPHTFSFTVDQAADSKGPAITHMRFLVPALDAQQHRQMALETSFGVSFEEHAGHVHAARDCKMTWTDDPAEAAYGRRAAKFTALDDDCDVQIMLHKNAFYMDRTPMLHFDYKAEPGFCTDLMIEALGEWMTVRFTGDGSAIDGGKAIGKIDAVTADNTWRHASVDLRALIDQAMPAMPIRIINKIMLSTHGKPGCKRGANLTIDNLDLVRSNAGGCRFEWTAESDPSGIEGYWFAIDQDPAGSDRPIVNCSSTVAPLNARSGAWYAHVRACDQAGNWGPTRTMRVDFGQ